MIDGAVLQERLDDAEANLVKACDEINALKAQLQELSSVARFWRNAAEHAIDGWNKLEDEHELLKETLRALVCEDVQVEDPPAAPDKVDFGDGFKLLVVEEEKAL